MKENYTPQMTTQQNDFDSLTKFLHRFNTVLKTSSSYEEAKNLHKMLQREIEKIELRNNWLIRMG
jgi:hypothetical protein